MVDATKPAPVGAKPKEKPVKKTRKAAKKGKRSARTNARKSAAPAAAEPDSTAPRAGSKLAIVVDLLKRPEGCTTKDVLAATGWPTVSMPQQAKAAGLALKKEKDGKVTRYRAAA